MAIQYKAYEFQIYNLISQFDQLLDFVGDSEQYPVWKEKASQMRKELENRTFRVAVVGEFNRGKTSLVNALLGKKILPEDYVPTTAALNRITYSDTPDSYIIFKDGSKKKVQISDLAEYVTKLTKESTQKASEIQEAVVEYPSLLCRNGVDLIDTPGLNDEDAMNAVTLSKLEGIDLALVAVDPSMPFSMTECKFTLKLLESPQVSQIVFVVTKMDMLRERERERAVNDLHRRIKENVQEELSRCHGEDGKMMQKYHEIFDDLHIFPVSSTDAMDALSCGDMDAYRKSGFWEMNNRLPDIIMVSQNQSAILTPARELKCCLKEVQQWIEKRDLGQNNQVKHYLEGIIRTFTDRGSNGIQNIFTQVDREIRKIHPMPENMTSAYIGDFEQAFKNIKSLNFNELKQAFAPVIRELYQNFNQIFHQKEIAYLTQYQAGTLKLRGKWSCEQLDKILRPCPELWKAMHPELTELLKCFAFYDITERKEIFFWTENPLPDISKINPNMDVMLHVQSALNVSIKDYQERRSKELKQMIEKSQERLNQQFESCKKKLLLASNEYLQQVCAQRQKVIMRVSKLEEEVSKLSEDFWAEIHS